MYERKITAARLTSEVGLSASAVTDWKKGKAKPSYGSVVKIANYFGVAPEYIMGETDDPYPESIIKPANELEYAFFNGFRQLDDEDRAMLNSMKDRMLELKRLKGRQSR